MPKEYYYNVTFDLDTNSVIYDDSVSDFYAEDLIGDEISAAEDEFLHDIIAKVEKNKHLTVDDFYNDFLWVRSDIELTEEDKARIIDIVENADYSDDGSSTAEIDTTSRWDWEESSVEVGFDYTINISASNVKIELEEVNESLDTKNFKLRESDEVNAMLDLMQNNDQFKDDPYVGSFWYDPDKDELFGIYSVLADREKFYKSKLFNQKVRTGTKLHKDIWRKEQFKKKDRRFNGDHTLVPRGRVFQLEDGSFKVMVGDWIDEYPQVKDEVLFEFQLPEDTEFVKDEHWNIGRGFSDEFLGEEYIVEKIIKKSDGYYVTSEDGEKNLGGPYKKKEDAEKRLGQVEFFKNKDKKKVNKSITEDFPWEDEDSFFTREDLDEFTEELRDITDPMGDGGVTIYKAYFEPGNMLEVDWSYADYEETSKMKIDMRKIKLPSDLIKRYLYSFKFLIDRRVNEIVSELKESLKESKVIDVSELKPFKTIKAPNGTFWSFYKKDNKIYDDNGIEVTDDEIRSLGLTESLTEAAEEIKPIDLFRNAYKSGDYRDDDKMMEIYHQANEYFKKHPVKLEDVPNLVTLNDKYKEDVNIDVYYDDAETMWPSEFEPAYGAIEDYGFEYEIIPTNVNGVIMVMSSMGNDFTTMEDFKKYLTDENVFNYETQEQAAEFERDGLFTTESLTESDEVPTFNELYYTLISKIKGEGWTKKDCLKHLKSVGLSKEDTEEMLQELTSEGYLKAHSVSRRDPNALYVSKDTKDMVEEGDKLADGSNEYIVTMVWKGPRSSTITVRDAEDWSPIYNTPISSWYGTKLIKGPFIRRDGKLVKED